MIISAFGGMPTVLATQNRALIDSENHGACSEMWTVLVEFTAGNQLDTKATAPDREGTIFPTRGNIPRVN